MQQIEHFELNTASPVALKLQAGCGIRVSHGRLWLTRSGHLEDRWLQAGQCWTLPASGRVWIGAEPVAQFQILRTVGQWPWTGLTQLRPRLPGLLRQTSAPLQLATSRGC